MKLTLDVQRVIETADIPSNKQLIAWASAALAGEFKAVELTIRIVGIDEMTALNATYRHKKGPTNVLSFPFEQPQDVKMSTPLLGDIVVCAQVVASEAAEQGKTTEAHWAHLVVHGCLHLLGMDHCNQTDAQQMEGREITTLKILGFKNPYTQSNEVS